MNAVYRIWLNVHEGLVRVSLLYPNGYVLHFPQKDRVDDNIGLAARCIVADLGMKEGE